MVTKTSDAEWNAAINAEGVTPDGAMAEGEILNKPSDQNPNAVRVSSLKFKGYVEIWNTKTGVRLLTPQFFLWQIAKMTHEDGKAMYTRTDPHIPLDHGQNLFCPLNPDSPDYGILKGRGYKPCRKQHIPNQVAVDIHVSHTHKRAFVSLKEERERSERAEDRGIYKELLTKLSTNATPQDVIVPAAEIALGTVAVARAKAPRRARNGVKPFICASGCDKMIKNQKMHDRNSHKE